METIRGKTSQELNFNKLAEQLADYDHILLDLGTGDGRFVCNMAGQRPDRFFIGIDACRENLHANSRSKLPNALFIIANAQILPQELHGLASHVTINFPWGSLLESLLSNEISLVNQLLAVTRLFASLDIRLNAEALLSAGWTLESGADQIQYVLHAEGWSMKSLSWMDAYLLRSFPTTWAKRLAFGRDPRAIHLSFQKNKI
jgi:16S rRNA (adenine(1408)-N(1))-methyltransferase